MRTIETFVTVDEHGMATIKMPPDITPGQHKVVMVIEEISKPKTPLTFAAHDIGPWPYGPEETFRREDMYGDDGR